MNKSTRSLDGSIKPSRQIAILSICVVAICVLLVKGVDALNSGYAYLAAYTILQYVALGTAWNILGGYGGYVNFGVAGFYAVGVYTSVVVTKTTNWNPILTLPIAGILAGILGLGMGYLTLRLRGVFFSIATLALAIVLNTFVVNWTFVGGSRGVYVLPPDSVPFFGAYSRFLFILMMALAGLYLIIARSIEISWIGRGLAALKDDEMAAECAGIPSLRIKLIATCLSGAMLGMVGVTLPYFVTYIDPQTAFGLSIAVNAIAMPIIGGMSSWVGPLIGAIILGGVQQIVTVTVSSDINLLIVGVVLVVFVVIAPRGIVGLVRREGRV